MLNIPRYIAGHLKVKLGLTSEQEEIALYSLEVLIYGAYAFLGTGLVGWLFGCFWPTLLIALTVFILRCFSGGAHSKSPGSCIFLSILLIPLSGKLVVFIAPLFTIHSLVVLIVIGTILSSVIIWRLAPIDTPSKPVSSERHRYQLKILSIFAVVFLFIIQGCLLYLVNLPQASMVILAIEGGLFLQIFSLSKVGQRFFQFGDNLRIRS